MKPTKRLVAAVPNLRNPHRTRGMTLIEVLVTLVIMSVGLLGVAALQMTSLRSNYDSFVRSQAAVLAGDILDRMRANRRAALNGDYNIVMGAPSTEMSTAAERDRTTWKATLAQQLPGGDGAIAIDPVTSVVTITIQWGERIDEDLQTAADTTVQFVTSSNI